MQHAFPSAAIALSRHEDVVVALTHDEALRVRRLRSLLALFVLYAVALLSVIVMSDGADVGCILGGIAGHVLYATARLITTWRDDCWLEDARARTRFMRLRVRA
jgi:hypothetical protein